MRTYILCTVEIHTVYKLGYSRDPESPNRLQEVLKINHTQSLSYLQCHITVDVNHIKQ